MWTVHSASCLHYRLLETDSKSLRSMNGSRRNSGSSLVSSSSASSNLSHLEEDSWILWGRIVNEWEEVRKKKEKQLKVRTVHVATCDVTVTRLMQTCLEKRHYIIYWILKWQATGLSCETHFSGTCVYFWKLIVLSLSVFTCSKWNYKGCLCPSWPWGVAIELVVLAPDILKLILGCFLFFFCSYSLVSCDNPVSSHCQL